MTKANSWIRKFEDALGDLVEQYLRDGMSGLDIQMVLKTRADDDYEELEIELQGERPGPHNFPDTYGCAGCICRMSSVNSATIDPPEPILNQWCPVHGGRDVDAMNDARRDDGVF